MSFGCLDDLKTIEHSTLKVPYESLNKQYRNVQKSIDRDCSSLSQAMSQVDKASKSASSDQSINRSDLINSMTNLVEKLRLIKKRSNDLRDDEKDLLELIKKRVNNLKEHESCTQNQLVNKNYRKLRLDRILIDYFLRNGFYNTAQLLASKNDLQYMTNMDIFMLEKEVVESLNNRETSKCLNWCNENKSKLKKLNVFFDHFF